MAKLIAPVTALGNIADKLGQGKQVFIGLNYGAQRVKKQAFEEQVERNISYTDSKNSLIEGVEFVKKNYKGNMEALKRHRDVDNNIESNKLVEFRPEFKPEDAVLGPMIIPRLTRQMKFLRVQRVSGMTFRFGQNLKLETELFPLKGADEDDDEEESRARAGTITDSEAASDQPAGPVLCMKYGNGVMIFDECVGQLNLKEVRNQVKGKMMEEQNGLTRGTITELQDLIKGVWMLSKFSK